MPSNDLQYVIDTAREAGQLALKYFGQVTGRRKGDGTLFSRADTESEQLIRERLAARWPHDAVVGEEMAGVDDISEGRAWLIDPVDGTLNFLYGLDEWCISIGMTDCGKPALGVVYAPATERLWYAEYGSGAFRNGTPIRAVRARKVRSNALMGCDSVAVDHVPIDLAPRKRNTGSAALHACYVAQGSFYATVYAAWGLWDVAAGLCICREAGAAAWRADGSKLESLGEFCATEKVRQVMVMCPASLRRSVLEGIETS